ncbi:16S rRNA (guanine(527)-N(7))-methyltransferase RsmG [Alpinimonas psychrophila]|uniref:Ribosomal RNA small subunit methyltransferase G n=1 Tax=Alpinimonas psychrophila TaxID=748908 RepID=A0A7W3PPB4_9MICO|nr:16S rRNA (guanine(527)-N(7))-methyltransferase RsmG [Alpinimonas psychrophila]MBA8829322.1 16S rRNA (guanine527-N7)-methyltransferase [Alpinimonas psychrophila]
MTTVYETEPAVAELIFGENVAVARKFTANLAQFGEELGLIGPLELPRLWTRHILNCAVMAPLLMTDGVVGDVGSGAGLPGLVLAIARPDVELVLIEPMERRVAWLNNQIAELGLRNTTVLRERAEDVRIGEGFDQVTARAVSALKKLIPLTVPLVRSGGEIVVMKGKSAEVEIESAAKQIRTYRLQNLEVLTLGEGLLAEVTRVVRATVN